MKSNTLKIRALEAFVRHGKLNPPAWAVLVHMHPKRAAYTYLLRLHRFGLLLREQDADGLLVYSISDRGRVRLRWLTANTLTSRHSTRAWQDHLISRD